MKTVPELIDAYLVHCQKIFGSATCSLTVFENQTLVTGTVLNQRQYDHLAQWFKDHGCDVELQLQLLVDLPMPPFGFGYADMTPTNVWRRPLFTDQISYLTNQIIIKEEPLKLLWETKTHWCVQMVDRTIGWVRKEQISRINGVPDWQPEPQRAGSSVELLRYLDRWLGVPYLLGGMTSKGVDCSGLVQNIYRHVFHYLLPRHSYEQHRVGTERQEHELQIGDIAFLEHRNRDGVTIGHVALIVDPKQKKVIHASKEMNHKVAYNTIAELLQAGYHLLGYRHFDVELI
ncbi:C40 family peptidase [Candidatus Gracilibacteria bacterium]|nr:C40 family peptidase [Candidatus Gracilibacteria bacterium]